MKIQIRARLSLMMFLEFFIWGGWFVTLGTYLSNSLNATGSQSAMAFVTQSWGAIIAPFVIGLVADRFFNAEKILGLLHLAGAVLMYLLFKAENFETFYPYMLVYMVGFMPTLALVNSVSFNQMNDPSRDFTSIRVWGTVGWIVAGLAISYVFQWDSASAIRMGLLKNTFLVTAIASAVLGVYSFTLPATPPKIALRQRSSLKEILGLDALKLLADKNFLFFFIASILICIPLAFYYQNANPFLSELGMANPTGKMTIGQASEVGFMLLLPFFFKRFGIKASLIAAMLAWSVRYILFAFGNAGEFSFMLITGIALHGVCYDFFFVSGQIYTNSKAGEHQKSATQGLITLATYGVGMLVGFAVAGYITDMYKYVKGVGGHNWQAIWLFPAGFAVVVTILFSFFFKNEKIEYKQ
ncbi:nucleoside permease [Flavobacterium daejeonense]|uniref:nucleoside permease n=1 Tax=Flavobacterium daejeonense TaxID=350893 RepID=UPI0004797A4F|nr:nucleoside permease [Flavobacterium daejeonense]